MCDRCNNTGLIPLVLPDGRVSQHAKVNCSCGCGNPKEYCETNEEMNARLDWDYPDGLPPRRKYRDSEEAVGIDNTEWRLEHDALVCPEPPPNSYACPRCRSVEIHIGYPNIICRHCGYTEVLIDYPISYSMHRALCLEYGQRDPGPDQQPAGDQPENPATVRQPEDAPISLQWEHVRAELAYLRGKVAEMEGQQTKRASALQMNIERPIEL